MTDVRKESVKMMDEEVCKDYKYNTVFDKEWKEAVAPFKKVEWVPKGSEEGKKLEVSK